MNKWNLSLVNLYSKAMKAIEFIKSQWENYASGNLNYQLCKNIYLSDTAANFPPRKYGGFSTKPS